MRWRVGVCVLLTLTGTLSTQTDTRPRTPAPAQEVAQQPLSLRLDPDRASRSRREDASVNKVASRVGLGTATKKGGHDGRLPRRAVPALASSTSHLNWHALAMCESTDNPRAVSSTGKYRGLYQFDLPTWHSNGGVGDPINASRAEQTRIAQLLFKRRGRSPWPYCGRFL